MEARGERARRSQRAKTLGDHWDPETRLLWFVSPRGRVNVCSYEFASYGLLTEGALSVRMTKTNGVCG